MNLGLEYYNTGHFSKTTDVWRQAWQTARMATDTKGKAVADRSVGELAYMYVRLGRMIELDEVLKSVEDRVFSGPATERIARAREGLCTMRTRPEISFRCGPLALLRIIRRVDPQNPSNRIGSRRRIHAARVLTSASGRAITTTRSRIPNGLSSAMSHVSLCPASSI